MALADDFPLLLNITNERPRKLSTVLAPAGRRDEASYRYAENRMADGSKREKELVIKNNDELPDGVRYLCMSFPTLPKVPDAPTGRDLSLLDPKTRRDIEIMQAYEKNLESKELKLGDKGWPFSEMFGSVEETEVW